MTWSVAEMLSVSVLSHPLLTRKKGRYGVLKPTGGLFFRPPPPNHDDLIFSRRAIEAGVVTMCDRSDPWRRRTVSLSQRPTFEPTKFSKMSTHSSVDPCGNLINHMQWAANDCMGKTLAATMTLQFHSSRGITVACFQDHTSLIAGTKCYRSTRSNTDMQNVWCMQQRNSVTTYPFAHLYA